MPDLRETMLTWGFTPSDVKYLVLRGSDRTRTAALCTKIGLNYNSLKASQFINRLTGKTGWSDDQHVAIGRVLAGNTTPVSTTPPHCPSCQCEDAERFSLHPLEPRCDKCIAGAIAAWQAQHKEAISRRSSRGQEIALAIENAEKEAASLGSVTMPTMDVLMSGAVEFAGGWEQVIASYAAIFMYGKPKERFLAAKEVFDYAAMREKADDKPLDISGCDSPEEAKRMIADALISQWHRKRERLALRDLIPEYGGVVPGDDREVEDEPTD